MVVKKFHIGWLLWDDKPPFYHWRHAELTWRQLEKYRRLEEYESLTEAVEYALKVGAVV